MRNTSIIEAERYASQLLPRKADIYKNGSLSYSNFKTLLLNREISIPKLLFLSSGMLPELGAFWYVTQHKLFFNLHIFRYDLDSVEVLSNFPSNICFVKAYKPPRGIFTSKIQHCLLVATETDVIVYGVETDTYSIINTDFSAKLYSKPTCIEIGNGSIFLGCSNGYVYHASCKTVDFLNYKYLSLYSPGNSLLRSLASVFSKKQEKISCMSLGKKYLVALSKSLEVYNVEHGIYREYKIEPQRSVSYVDVQIVEENPILFYCVQLSGVRDFYSTEFVFSRDPAVVESTDFEKITQTSFSRILSVRTSSERSTLVLVTFNEDQYKNFSRFRAVENFEVATLYSQVLEAELTDTALFVQTPSSILQYSIFDSRRLLLNSRPQEIYQLYKNYGDIEFMIKYFQLITENEDVGKLEGLCKNDSIKTHALFIWIYTLIAPIWRVDLHSLRTSDEASTHEAIFDDVLKRLKLLRQRLTFGYNEARDFIDEFIQTGFYVTLLLDYNIPFRETFESILTQESDFKTHSLKAFLDTLSLGQSIEPLIKTMQNGCPIYLPLENINLQRGLQLIKKNDKDSLFKSLEYLTQSRLDLGVIHKFNELGFFYGSTLLLREKYNFDYETGVSLFIESVKCKRAFDCGLEDSREVFLYPFFEAILLLDGFSPCVCCGPNPSAIDLLSIKNAFFGLFLKDQLHKNERAYNLYWKYLLMRGEKIEAIQSLLALSQRTDLPLSKKIEFLHTALSISAGKI